MTAIWLFRFRQRRTRQVWIGDGIGITPFIAGMKHLAQEQRAHPDQSRPLIDLFHTTADYDEKAFAKQKADAEAANIRMHILVDSRDGPLTSECIRTAVPEWHEASIWFCGPAGFGKADSSVRREVGEQLS
ncbi:hypothetical protein [Chelativorans xinjiangense]|uniref:hypothetical protein n=1 Tax=Chelativorans xinjiangense TaxID=2681485 RepID=UPI001915789C|nr:hypothetical protein [Chelativorans xinjiangense]